MNQDSESYMVRPCVGKNKGTNKQNNNKILTKRNSEKEKVYLVYNSIF